VFFGIWHGVNLAFRYNGTEAFCEIECPADGIVVRVSKDKGAVLVVQPMEADPPEAS